MRRGLDEDELMSLSWVGTDRDVLISGLSAVQVVLGEELQQLGLDAAERLVLPMKQHHQVRHGEGLTHQHQQLSKEP